jgi:hypothetical protein
MDISALVAQATAHADIAAEDASSGGGWLSAVAKAMGKALGIQAARVTALSNAIAENASKNTGGKDPGADAKQAAEAMALNTQFQAASQELSITSNAFATAIKALGEASTTLARKQ